MSKAQILSSRTPLPFCLNWQEEELLNENERLYLLVKHIFTCRVSQVFNKRTAAY